MRKPLPTFLKERFRAEMYANCKNPSGDPSLRDSVLGCGSHDRVCNCQTLFSCMQRHGDFGFDYSQFKHNIEEIIVDDREPLHQYLADPKTVWHEGKGLYIWSDAMGVGKTTLAHLVVRQLYSWRYLARQPGDYRAWYMLSGEFADRAHWKGRDGFLEKYDWGNDRVEDLDLFGVDLFVLDELGRENRDDRRTQSGRYMMEHLLRERQNRVTIMVSHHPPKEVTNMYGEHVASMMARSMATVNVSVKNGDRRRPDSSPF